MNNKTRLSGESVDLKSTLRSLGLLCCGMHSMTSFVCLRASVYTSGFWDICQFTGKWLEISALQSVCSGQLLSAKNGSLEGGCAAVLGITQLISVK